MNHRKFPFATTKAKCFSANFHRNTKKQHMWDLLDLAAKDTACAAKVWDCFVNRDTEAKKWIKNVCDITGWGEVDER